MPKGMGKGLRQISLAALLGFGAWAGSSPSVSATPGEIHIIGMEGAVLYAAPDPASPRRAVAEAGDRVMEFRSTADWVLVRAMAAVGIEGWVARQELAAPLPEAAAAEPAAGSGDEKAVSETSGEREIFILELTGRVGLEIKGSCQILQDGARPDAVTFAGYLPAQYRIEASAVSCKIRKRDIAGRLTAELSQGPDFSVRATTSVPFNRVRVRSDGPWGQARGGAGPRQGRPVSTRPGAVGAAAKGTFGQTRAPEKLERRPKSANRFSDKPARKIKNVEHRRDSEERSDALEPFRVR